MVDTRIAMHDDLLHVAFDRFDVDGNGYITVENMCEVVGGTPNMQDMEEISLLIGDADQFQGGKISYEDFVAYLRGTDAKEDHVEAVQSIVDHETSKQATRPSLLPKKVSDVPDKLSPRCKCQVMKCQVM